MTLKDVAYSGITVIFAIALVMFTYTTTYEIVTVTLYNFGIDNGMPAALANDIILIWDWFPIVFLFCILIWMVYTATIGGNQTWE